MENEPLLQGDVCDVCLSITELAKHSMTCTGHPEVCMMCKSFYHIIEYHLKNCNSCEMHLCTKLKLKLMKYNLTVNSGLAELWPKIQQYVSRLFPDKPTSFKPISNSSIVGGKFATNLPSHVLSCDASHCH